MKEVVIAWGLSGFLGVAGCYLVISGIIGGFVPIFPIIRSRVEVAGRNQRLMLSLFGLLLALPVMVHGYMDLVLGVRTVLRVPPIPERVEDVESKTAAGFGWQSSGFQPIAYWSEGCDVKEAFGLAERESRQLKYGDFRGAVWVGVDRLSAFEGSDVFLQVDKDRMHFYPKRKGDYFDFIFENRRYRLTVVGIYSALVGSSRLAFEVCQW